jgi:hypothetical protein
MTIKNLAAVTACVAALGAGVGVAPAAAKNDKDKSAAKAAKQAKRCDTDKRHFKCVTETGETTSGQCPADYTVIDAFTASVEADLNGDGFVCYSATLGYVDDKIL